MNHKPTINQPFWVSPISGNHPAPSAPSPPSAPPPWRAPAWQRWPRPSSARRSAWCGYSGAMKPKGWLAMPRQWGKGWWIYVYHWVIKGNDVMYIQNAYVFFRDDNWWLAKIVIMIIMIIVVVTDNDSNGSNNSLYFDWLIGWGWG